LKRATRTPNRFIISTRSWPVKGLALFLILLALGSCEDELGLIGSRKPNSRFGVFFREFDIPVTTVQADSIVSEAFQTSRFVCGEADDPFFGKVSTKAFLQFAPTTSFSTPKIDVTDKSNFNPTSLTVYFLLDYYVYGDTLDGVLDFSLHRIKKEADFFYDQEFYTTSSLDYETDPLAVTSFNYKKDSIADHKERNSDNNTANNRYDTLKFIIPVDAMNPMDFAGALLDTATAKGVYYENSQEDWVLNLTMTDSVFRRVFPGFALVSGNSNRILGFQLSAAKMTLQYSYVLNGNTVNSSYGYSLSAPSFSSTEYNRTGTSLAGLNSTYQDFSAPDDFGYLQSGTGVYAKLDFSAVHSYFDADPDTIKHMALNAAELLVEAEPETTRKHLSAPNFLYIRAIQGNNKFIENEVTSSLGYDTELAVVYYCLANRRYLDALGDATTSSATVLEGVKDATTGRVIYSTYVTNFFQNLLDGRAGYSKLNSMAILPADGSYGTSFHGLSFNKDKVKLRIYYTKTL
jgi:hypothetical protein